VNTTKRHAVAAVFGALLAAAGLTITRAHAESPLDQVVGTLRAAHGHYEPRSASLTAADCSGLVSVAQTLAMGQAPHRLGNTASLLAGRWPGAIPGATPADEFVIGTNSAHMAASLDGVNVEARQSGEQFRVGADAASPFDRQFTRQYHIDPTLLTAADSEAEQ
jgi:hypothetical protein